MEPKSLSPADRVAILLDHFGLDRVHVAACMSGDWGELVTGFAERLSSLTLVAPHLNKGVPEHLHDFTSPSLVIAGDQGAPAQRARELTARFGRGELYALQNYSSPPWADTIADRTAEIGDAIDRFLGRADGGRRAAQPRPIDGKGEIAGLRYTIQGQGPPLLLMPLSLSPSQWQPLLDFLTQRYCVIVLGGAHLGVVPLLEERAKSGYGELIAGVLDRLALAAGEAVLEVGCGSGAVTRAIVGRLDRSNRVVAADINPYLLSEAAALARKHGVADAIDFQQANAERLPYGDDRFDVAICTTVLEEGDADRMAAELSRVIRPGGRLAVLTRAIDVDWWVNLPVSSELKRRIDTLANATGAGVGERGCADASLYTRLIKVGLAPSMLGPQFAIYRDGERLDDVLDRLIGALGKNDAEICREAIRQGRADRTLFVAEPFHCAIVTKPSNRRAG